MQKLAKKGTASMGVIVGIIIGVLVVTLILLALIPTIKQSITDNAGNLTAAETALLGIVPLLLVIAVVFLALKASKSKG